MLESTISTGDFICKEKPTLYTFFCTAYGSNLVWHFNGENVAGFLSNDAIGTTFSKSYPPSAPVYNITAILALVSNETFSRYDVPFCVSILTIQSFNESQTDAPVIPFNVSCQTYCADKHRTEVCQVKDYQVAGTHFVIVYRKWGGVYFLVVLIAINNNGFCWKFLVDGRTAMMIPDSALSRRTRQVWFSILTRLEMVWHMKR